jgi:hypothetical protein
MFKSFGAIAFAGVVSAIDEETFQFMNYLSKFNKSYSTVEEFNVRLALFSARNKFIVEWNADETNTHKVGHNFLSDYNEKELSNLRGIKDEFATPKHVTRFEATTD